MDTIATLGEVFDRRRELVSLYEQQKSDVQSGRLPDFQFARDNLLFEGELALKIYAVSFHLRELARYALKDKSLWLEQSKKEELETMVKELTIQIEDVEKRIPEGLYKGYESGF